MDPGYFLDIALVTFCNGVRERIVHSKEEQESGRHEEQHRSAPGLRVAVRHSLG